MWALAGAYLVVFMWTWIVRYAFDRWLGGGR